MKVFISHSDSEHDCNLVKRLSELLYANSCSVISKFEIQTADNFFADISASIRSADIFIAFISSNNPNIFYELGLATGANVPILITSRVSEQVPQILGSIPYVQLSEDANRDVQTIARRALEIGMISDNKITIYTSAMEAIIAATNDPTFLESISAAEFEQLIIRHFKELNFTVEETKEIKEFGVDFTLKGKGIQKAILVNIIKQSKQCRVSVESVRNLVRAVSYWELISGILIAPSGFTSAAIALAEDSNIILCTLRDMLDDDFEKSLLAKSDH